MRIPFQFVDLRKTAGLIDLDLFQVTYHIADQGSALRSCYFVPAHRFKCEHTAPA